MPGPPSRNNLRMRCGGDTVRRLTQETIVRGRIHFLRLGHGKQHLEEPHYCLHRYAGRETTASQLDELPRSTQKWLHLYMGELGLGALGSFLAFLTCESSQIFSLVPSEVGRRLRP